jgi:glutamine amidotransferase
VALTAENRRFVEMCRLFAMSGGTEPVRATFWLLEAPDSLSEQSRRQPDGTGLGTFRPDGAAEIHKWPIAAYEDRAFVEEAREVESTVFVAHIRYASTGAIESKNTHPFELKNRIFAHNGVIQGLARLERELGPSRSLVRGDTDSERFFALVTRCIDDNGGDVGAGLTRAARWVAANLPIYALNVVLATASSVWALRYPDTHALFFLERDKGGPHGNRHMEAASAAGTIRMRSAHLATHPAVILASERMDENPGWQPLASGELLHVGPDLAIHREIVLEQPPAHLLTLNDLDPRAAASQHPSPGAGA